MSPGDPLVVDVSDTARWVAFHRALESERPDALFRDPFARRLAGERGRRIAEEMPALTHGLTWALSVRTRVYDDLILDLVRTAEIGAVLNLAAGLDARPYRLPLPPSLVWVEADLPAILATKSEALSGERAACRVERLPVDLADPGARRCLLARVAALSARVLVVTEGLLEYLEERVVRELAGDLRGFPSMYRWLLAIAMPEVVKQNMRAWGKVLRPAHAEMKFASPDGLAFFRPHGWSPVVARSCIPEARRLGREMRHAWMIHAVAALSKTFRRKLEAAVTYGVMEQAPVREDRVVDSPP